MQLLLEQLPLLLLHKTSSPSARQLRRQHCHVHLLLQLVNGFRDHLLHNPTLEGGLYSLTIVKRQLIYISHKCGHPTSLLMMRRGEKKTNKNEREKRNLN